jgi:RNase P subunit RPR2
MFDHVCTACRQRWLIFSSQVTSIVNDERGVHVHFTCWCGAEQRLDTGRAADLTRPTVAA